MWCGVVCVSMPNGETIRTECKQLMKSLAIHVIFCTTLVVKFKCFLGMDLSSGVTHTINNLVDCGFPTMLKGAKILTDFHTTMEASVITLICTDGLFSNYTITSVCTSKGEWSPDPAEFSCLPETSGMFRFLSYIQ